MPLFDRVTVAGLGLIGGSVALALKRRRVAKTVIGLSRTPATAARAKRLGAVDIGTTNEAAAVRDSELLIVATPVNDVVPRAARLARLMRRRSIVTDVGSTKRAIVEAAQRRLPRGVAFVGAHPLAGSEQHGLAAARADLFDGSICVITPTATTDPTAQRLVSRLWKAVGSRVVAIPPQVHDRCLAQVSHLPHVIAFALMHAADRDALALAPRSFLEATRVAKSCPDLWDDILVTNRSAVLAAMDRFERIARRVRRLVERADTKGLNRFLRHAQTLRETLDQ